MESIGFNTNKEELKPENWRELDLFGNFPNGSKKYPSNKIESSRFTFYTLIPKSIYEQLHKLSNLWFLTILVIAFFDKENSLWYLLSILAPLSLVIGINLIKDIFSFISQRKSDEKANTQKCLVWNGGDFIEKLVMDVLVSDIVLVFDKETVPADILLFSSGNFKDCYADTSLVLGERNLQIKKPIKDTSDILTASDLPETILNINRLNGIISVKNPDTDEVFTGKIKLRVSPRATKLSSENLILKGSIVTNTPWVLGYVVYTGPDTSFHIQKKPVETSVTDKIIEKWSFFIMIGIIVLVSLYSIISHFWTKHENSLEVVFSYLKIIQNLVPIGLFVAIYIIRIRRAYEINKNYKGVMIKNVNCVEDLGQIEYIVADKTGTITKNELRVQVCILGEKMYWNYEESLPEEKFEQEESDRECNRFDIEFYTFKELRQETESRQAYHFLLCMALCNSTYSMGMGEEYLSLSVDDKVLVETALLLGMKLLTRNSSCCTLSYNSEELEFIVLGFHHSSPTSKKSRILVKDSRLSEGYLYIKGSKEEMLDIFRLSYEDKTNIEEFTLSKHLIRMRTILMGFKQLSSQELEEFDFAYGMASSSPVNSTGRVDGVFETLEKNCEYIGIAALEDIILDKTRDCLSTFSKAGIKTWITSGDNEETTLTAGVSSRLFEENVRVVRLTHFSSENECKNVMVSLIKEHILHEQNAKRENSYSFIEGSQPDEDGSPGFRIQSEPMLFKANSSYSLKENKQILNKLTGASSPRESNFLIKKDNNDLPRLIFNPNSVYFILSVDKTGLEYGISNEENRELFISLLFAAHCVCFHSLQFDHKIKVVKLIKKNFNFAPVVLTISDGQCDAGMLQEGNVSVRIDSSNTNYNNTDVSLTDFYQLQNMLLVEGFWSCNNLATIAVYCFYSKFLLVTVTLLFNSVSLFSGNVFIDDELIVIYQVLISVIQMIFVGLYDQNISENAIFMYPQVYSLGIYKEIFTLFKIFTCIVEGILHGVIVCVFLYFLALKGVSTSGRMVDFESISVCANFCVFFISTIKLLIETHSFYWKTIIGHLIGGLVFAAHYLIRIEYGPWVGFDDIIKETPSLLITLVSLPFIIYILQAAVKTAKWLFLPDILQFVNNIKNFEISLDLISRLNYFKDELRKVYKKSNDWKNKKDQDSLEFNKKTLRFCSEQQETEYNVGKIIENVKTYRVLLMTSSGLIGILIIVVIITQSKYSVMLISLLPCFVLIFVGFSALSFTEFFKAHFQLFLNVFYVLVLVVLIIVAHLYGFSMISGYSVLLIIFFIAFNSDWFVSLIISIISAMIASVGAYVYYQNSLKSGVSTILFMIYYICLLLNSAAVGFNIDKTKRQEYVLIRKVEMEVDKSKSVLSYLLPAFVRKRVKDGVRYIAESQGTVSILFCDIMDFDEIVAIYTPVELTAFLDDVFGKLDQICSQVGVTKIETVGKTYMACAGLKDSDAELDTNFSSVSHARRAIEMGLSIIRIVSNIHLRKGVTLSVKIGINSGNVTAGVIGSHKPQFSLVGDTVNTASRMASTCPNPNTLQISKSTYELLDDKKGLVFTSRTVEVKGKGNMETFIVRVPVGILETSMYDTSLQFSIKVANSPNQFVAARSMSIYARNSFADNSAGHERRVSALFSHLEISDAVQLFQRKDTELIEQVQWCSFRCKEKKKEKNFRIETLENNKDVIMFGMIVIILSNACTILVYGVYISKEKMLDFAYVIKLCIETIFESLLLFGLTKYLKELWYAWSLQIVYISSIIVEIIIGTFEQRDSTIQFISFLNHVLLFSHCGELFLKHNFWSLLITTALFIVKIEVESSVSNISLTVFTLIAMITLIFTVYTGERNLRINSTLKAAANKELDKTEKLIKQMMPPHVVQNLKEQSTKTDKIPQVTILYADIVGFTAWSAPRTPEEIVTMFSQLFTMFDKNCVIHNVYKVHTIGDCYVAMGFTGENLRNPGKECINIIEFAKSMLDMIDKFNYKNDINLNMRIGIHTGDVIAGVTGTSIVRYDIYGSDVMIANKIESCGIPGKILVSEATKNMVEENRLGDYQFLSHVEFFVKTTKKKIFTFLLSSFDI